MKVKFLVVGFGDVRYDSNYDIGLSIAKEAIDNFLKKLEDGNEHISVLINHERMLQVASSHPSGRHMGKADFWTDNEGFWMLVNFEGDPPEPIVSAVHKNSITGSSINIDVVGPHVKIIYDFLETKGEKELVALIVSTHINEVSILVGQEPELESAQYFEVVEE